MAGKMNWDRVRKENQSRRYGSEWIGSDAVGLIPGAEAKPSPKKKVASRRTPLDRVLMPGCTCRKKVGFGGLHKKSCPVSKSNKPQAELNANSLPTLRQFAECMKKTGKLSDLRSFLSILQKEVDVDGQVAKEDRVSALKLIQTLRDYLADVPSKKAEEGQMMNSSHQTSLKGFVQARLHTYLRADYLSATRAVESVAKGLKLPFYRFQCSPATKHSDLWGYTGENGKFHQSLLCKAFTHGGIFCVEHVEKADPEFQFWLKAGLDDLASTAGGASLKRHPDFVTVVTSTIPIRELWSGQVDDAFVDRLLYLDALTMKS
jgi:hypothetical protein